VCTGRGRQQAREGGGEEKSGKRGGGLAGEKVEEEGGMAGLARGEGFVVDLQSGGRSVRRWKVREKTERTIVTNCKRWKKGDENTVSLGFGTIQKGDDSKRTFLLYRVVTPTLKNPPLIGLAAKWLITE
jgi:hypothetical protein